MPAPSSPWRLKRLGEGGGLDLAGCRVVDLSSLWAGPLAAQLLRQLGAEVTKVESSDRPDGLRAGEPEQFERLNRGKAELILEFRAEPDRAHLHRLCEEADVVVISARRRAADSLGLDLMAPPLAGSRLVLAISAHGWSGPGARFVGFGDDAAVAGGLTAAADDGGPTFVADAAADPLAGALGALATAAAARRGGSWLIDAPLARAAAFAAGPSANADPAAALTLASDEENSDY